MSPISGLGAPQRVCVPGGRHVGVPGDNVRSDVHGSDDTSSPHGRLVRLSGRTCVLSRSHPERLAEVAVEMALVKEPGLQRNLGDRDAALEHPTGDTDSTCGLKAVRRHPIRRTEKTRKPVPADTRGTR
jgi:hypothetical protein